MSEKVKKRKTTRKRPSFWAFYAVALPLALAFMIFEFLAAVG
jgi:hypothetical protein